MKYVIIVYCFVLLYCAAPPLCSQTVHAIPPMQKLEMTEKERRNVETIKKLVQGFADGNLAQINDLVHEDFINHHAPEGMRDREGFRKIVAGASGAFSSFDSFSVEPAIVFAKDDYVAMIDVAEGTKNGQKYDHIDIHVFIMKDGKMYQHWNSFGLPSMRERLMKFMQETGE